MDSDSGHWFELGEPATPAERQALDRFRELLPSNGSTFAWANLTVIDHSGRTDEIDVLLLCRRGMFVVELKGWAGTIRGTQQSWRITGATGRHTRTERNPLLLTDAKAKRLASLLRAEAPGRSKSQVPFIGPLVVLHGRDSTVDLDEIGRTNVLALDGYNVSGLPTAHGFEAFVDAEPANDGWVIDANHAKQVLKIVGAAGLKPTPKTRMVGNFSLERVDPLGEGPNWQDVLAVHPEMDRVRRRIRLFDIPAGASAEKRQEIERAAKRAFSLTTGINHPGIEQSLDLISTESGPALIYEYDESAQPLDSYLEAHPDDLSLDQRLELIRGLGEALQYAHDRRLVHRGLTPRQVYVHEADGVPRISIRDWQTASRSHGETTASSSQTAVRRGSTDPRALVQQEGWIYLAPEAHSVAGTEGAADLPSVPLDVYGFGSLAYLILTGNPPAKTFAELHARLQESGGLDPQRDVDSLSDDFAQAVLAATAAVEADRTQTVADVLEELDGALANLTAPAEPDGQARATALDPLSAVKGQVIADRFEVIGRRGSGSTGVAFEVDDYIAGREQLILKVANDDDSAHRLQDEAEALSALNSPRIVRLVEGPLEVDGRQALLLSDAGKETLAARLATEGRAILGQLDRYGADLFEAVAHLDSRGVFHRDIKPANLGISSDPSTRRPRLVLFDFSLSREPLANITSGTRSYLDPYLGTGRRRQFDRAAELYAIATTLFEMATHELPWWESGDAGPASPSDRVVLTEQMFESSAAARLVEFFTRVLAPDVTERFGAVSEMAAAWRLIFQALTTDGGEATVSQAELDADADRATEATPLPLAGLSPHALSALDRLAVGTVGDLLSTSPTRINAIRGLGESHRKEIQRRVRQWRKRLLTDTGTTTVMQPSQPGDRSVEAVLDPLIPRPSKQNTTEVVSLRLMLGVRTPLTADDDNTVVTDGLWPSVTEIADRVGVTRARVSQIVEAASKRWGRRLDDAHDELVKLLSSEGGVVALPEAAHALLVAHGSTADGPERVRLAAGLVRAIYEVDSRAPVPALSIRRRRSDGSVLLAVSPLAAGVDASYSAEDLLGYAQRLGARADALIADGYVVPAGRALSALQAVADQGLLLSSERLMRLAVAASEDADLSGRGELYPRTLSGEQAARVVLERQPMRDLSIDMLKRKVTQRFPAAGEMPIGVALDELVTTMMPGMRREGGGYTHRTPAQQASSSSTYTQVPTKTVSEVDRLLRDSLQSAAGLTLAVHPHRYADASDHLTAIYRLAHVDVATELVQALRSTAAEKRVDWDVVRVADAKPPDSLDGANLRRLVEMAYSDRWHELLAAPEPLLLTNVAPLLRYGMGRELSELLDLGTHRPAARWILVPRRGSDATPLLDGAQVPLGPGGWVDLPKDLSTLVPENTAAPDGRRQPSERVRT